MTDPKDYTRLRDREHRTGKEFFRKRVFVKSDNAHDKHVLIQFHPNFKKIFLNYIKAYQVVPESYIGTLLRQRETNLELEIAYLGEQITTTETNLRQVVELLQKINSIKRQMGVYVPSRYLTTLQNSELHDEKSLKPFFEWLDRFTGRRLFIPLGSGIEDPAVSNFTCQENHVYLVDLDNFDDHYNLDSLIGFLIADASLLLTDKMSPKSALAQAAKLRGAPVDPILFLSGFMGRVAVILIDEPNIHTQTSQQAVMILNQYAVYARDFLSSEA